MKKLKCNKGKRSNKEQSAKLYGKVNNSVKWISLAEKFIRWFILLWNIFT